MDILTIQTIRQNINRANSEMYSVKENVKAAIVMSILGGLLIAITSHIYFGYEAVSTEEKIFLGFHFVAGIGALVFAIVMIINCVIDFRRASRRMRDASSMMYHFEQSIYRKAA